MDTKKKAQMEILGLAIVVVLLILGMVFVIEFIVTKKPSNLKKDIVESQVASNYLSTYLDTSVPECNSLTITELLQDCAAQGGIKCQDSKPSCDKAKEVAQAIFARTFDQRKLRYDLSAFLSEKTPILSVGKICTGEKRSKTFPIPTRAGTLFVRLNICG